MKTLCMVLVVLFGLSAALADIGGAGNQQPLGALRVNQYNPYSLQNPYGAGNPYRSNGLLNPYSPYGNRFSARSWTNPYATRAPKLYERGRYRGRLSMNPYAADSTSNPFGRYGNPFSADSINNPFGAGNPFSQTPIYVRPGD